MASRERRARGPPTTASRTLIQWRGGGALQWLAREVAVARYVAGRGGPVVPPVRGVDPGPHWQDGFAISLWEYVGGFTGPRPEPGPRECGALLARFHRMARDCPAELGDLSPATEQVTDALAVIERERLADAATIARLRAAHARALDGIGGVSAGVPRLVLHGDAHAGNVIRVGGGPAPGGWGWAWTDLEETTRGPAGWDLATLVSRYDEAGARAALHSYAAELAAAPTVARTPGTRGAARVVAVPAVPGVAAIPAVAIPELEALAPFRRARDLEAAVWLLCMAHLYPERYASPARDQLATVIATISE